MSNAVISVQCLSKRYQIGKRNEKSTRQRSFSHQLRSSFHYLASTLREPTEDEIVWALRDVSFEINQGEVVGIIGKNGSGKSTLLKILSRVTEPTSGQATIYGRVGSLLEVGTGFHPELTGRENILLSGAILGMRRSEIEEKFDQIVSFSGVDRFIDTPVKRYSSGMKVRLGFAVAAHLEPEVLVVDEVLAVGDAQFQAKCLGKMEDISKSGRTVVFVSHSMGAIDTLCDRCIVLDKGKIVAAGDTREMINTYLELNRNIDPILEADAIAARGNAPLVITAVQCEPSVLSIGEDLRINIHFHAKEHFNKAKFGVSIETVLGKRLSASYMGAEGLEQSVFRGDGSIAISFPKLPFLPGDYYVTVAAHDDSGTIVDRVERSTHFRVMETDISSTGNFITERFGIVWLDHLRELD